MNKNLKKVLILILVLNLFSISFAGKGGGGCSITKVYDKVYLSDLGKVVDRDQIPSNIYDPYGNELYRNNDFYDPKILTMTNVPNFYTNPDLILTDYNQNIIKQFNYETGSLQAQNLKYNCQIGGQYTTDGYYARGESDYKIIGCNAYGIARPIPENLFYCKTTKDLFNQVQIPRSWQEDEIIIYCNEGLNSNFKFLNIDFLTTKLDTYNTCIVKNLDLTNNNTIIYGFEKGNQVMDYNVNTLPVIEQIFSNYETGMENTNSEFQINEEKLFTLPKLESTRACQPVEDYRGDEN